MSAELLECEARVTYWRDAAGKAEWAWLKYTGSPWEKERLRRAYEFADRLLLGWERRRDALQLAWELATLVTSNAERPRC